MHMVTWDAKKRKQVLMDHGVDLAKVADVFDDPFAIDYEDTEHSVEEARRAIIGRSEVYGLVLVIYAVRGNEIRCITARRAERWMARMYEEQRKRY